MKLSVADLKELVKRFKALIKERTGKSFPQDPQEQLWGSISAVFGSWMNDRAMVYRRKYGIPHDWGTAVNVQTMVFGNMGETSATGVAFTRDPASGEKVFYGEYLINAQGEDVVAGVRTPHPIVDLAKEMPAAHKGLMKVRAILEQHFKDMQDLEFTVEDNRLYILQTRNGKRTGHAAVRIAVDMVDEKLISKKDAVKRIPADSLAHLLAPIFDRQSARDAKKIGSGLAAGPGAASGHVVFSAEEAVARSEKGEKVVLARVETSPEDLRGMIAAEGILTSRGGVSSHAALVARQMGKVCVCGASGVRIDYQKRTLNANGTTLNQGDYISIDGTAGEVFAGEVTTAPSEIVQVLVDRSLDGKKSETYREYEKLMRWVDEFRTLDVRTNADTPEQVKNAIAFGAQGIGLCRTEHMFFEGNRIDAMREMILAGSKDARARWRSYCPINAMILPESSMRSTDFQRRFAFSIRHCTSFCRTIKSSSSTSRKNSVCRWTRFRGACTNCTSSTPCWGIVAAVWELFTRKFPRCRRAPYSKRRPQCRRKARKCGPKL